MKNEKSSHGGAYLGAPARHQKIIVGILLCFVVIAAVAVFVFKGTHQEKIHTYRLPEELPNISLPTDISDFSNGKDLNDLVIPYYDFALQVGNDTVQINLPVVQAGYGKNFNTEISERLDTLIHNVLFYHERNESYIIKEMSYEAHLDQDILTILLWTSYTNGQRTCENWSFDIADSGTSHDTWKLVEKLLGLDYSTFLWTTDCYLQSAFSEEYEEADYYAAGVEVSEEQKVFQEVYNRILQEIPRDVTNALNRSIFPSEGKIYLIYDFPLISENNFETETRLVELDDEIFYNTEKVTPLEAIKDVIYNSDVHVMGGTDQAHALLIRGAFFSSPELFIEAVSLETDKDYAIANLLRYADEEEQSSILTICENIRGKDALSNNEKLVLDLISSKIITSSTSDF